MEELENPKIFQTMLLLGAGSSIPAGIPSIKKMTEEFLANPLKTGGFRETGNFLENEKAYKRKFNVLSNISEKHYDTTDLELIMSIILQLRDYRTRSLFSSKYGLFNLFRKIKDGRAQQSSYYEEDLLDDLKTKLETYIRRACENIKSIEYLWPLQGLVESGQLEIYTLNYDAIIEMFCEKNDIPFTDGFDPYWHPENFAKNLGINLYKLHGSLYWLRTESGKTIKVPIKGLKVSEVRYLTDEKVSEMMIYPVLQKNKQPIVYSWLSQKFKEQLNHFQTCIVIGYRFRDEDIQETMLESLFSNKQLWLVLVNPRALNIKKNIFSSNNEIASKIVVMNMGIEEALRDRKLHEYLSKLETARTMEEQGNSYQQKTTRRLDNQYWNNILINYLKIEHHDRVKWVVEKIRSEKFDDISGNFPDTIEGVVCAQSLKYALEYKSINKIQKMKFWLDIFLGSCIGIELSFFERRDTLCRENNPVKEEFLPDWIDRSARTDVEYLLDELLFTAKQIMRKMDKRSRIHKFMSKFIETLQTLTYKEKVKGGGYRMIESEHIIKNYKEKELGIRKWSREIVDELKQS